MTVPAMDVDRRVHGLSVAPPPSADNAHGAAAAVDDRDRGADLSAIFR